MKEMSYITFLSYDIPFVRQLLQIVQQVRGSYLHLISLHITFLQPATNVFVAGQVDRAR